MKFSEYFGNRVSIRNFSNEKISNEKIEKIIQLASHAPTCGNMQLYSVIITRNGEKRKLLNELHYNQPAAVTADVILTICADYKLFTDWCKLNDAEPGYNNFHSFIMAMTDAVIFAQQIVTIAELNGISTCYLGTVNYNAKEISNLLKLPKMVIPVASIALGISKKNEPKVERLPLNAIIHYDEYDLKNNEEIKSIFEEKENLETNKKYLQENNLPTLAHVFTKIRYNKTDNEKISKDFFELIKEKGFISDDF